MDYNTMVAAIKRYLKKRYNFFIRCNMPTFGPFCCDRKDIITYCLPQIDPDTLQILLEKMYEDGYIIKDDAITLTFSVPFVFK